MKIKVVGVGSSPKSNDPELLLRLNHDGPFVFLEYFDEGVDLWKAITTICAKSDRIAHVTNTGKSGTGKLVFETNKWVYYVE